MGWWVPLEAVWFEQPSSEEPAEFLKWFNSLNEAQKVLFPTHWVCSEVYNGGFHQYFTNSTGLHAPEAIEGFRKLGLADIADILQEAVSIFGTPYPRQRDIREDFLAALGEVDPFDRLNELFYEKIRSGISYELTDGDRFTEAAEEFVSKADY